MTIGTTTIAAGWYADPAGSSALRWWDGNQWTNHFQQPTPPPPQTPVQQPVQPTQEQQPESEQEPSLSRYSPLTGFANPSPDSQWSLNPLERERFNFFASMNNTTAWVSLATGVLATGAAIYALTGHGLYDLPFFGLSIVAVSGGIHALLGYRLGRVTVLWPPLVGLVLGILATVALALSTGLTASHAGALPAGSGTAEGSTVPQSVFGPTGSTTTYDVGTGVPQYSPDANLPLSQAVQATQNIVALLGSDYANNKTGAAADGSWPTSLNYTTNGYVNTSDGRALGPVLTPGWHLAYTVEADGSFVLEVSAANTSEVAMYISKTDEYVVQCESTDTACKTDSPVAPQTSTSSTAGATN